ncbi:MAG: TlpA family protein disulfide reductase [Candidatus Odinarchaeota archaeon]
MTSSRRRGTKKPQRRRLKQNNGGKNALDSLDNIHRTINRGTQQRQFLKKGRNPYLIPAIVLIAVVSLVGFASISNFGQATTGTNQTSTGNQMITGDFELQDVYSQVTYKMSDYKSSLILLDFMATWCVYCPYSYPELQDLHQKYPQVEIFTVSVDPDFDTVDKLINYARDHSISWHVARDTNGVSNEARFQVTGTPTTVLIDKNFNIVEKHVGVASFETMEQWIIGRL